MTQLRRTAAGAGEGFEVDIAGVRYPVTLSRRPFYDPSGTRVRE
jgi:hypothetical protein